MIANEEQARAFVAQRCDADAMARLDRLASELAAENAHQNLVSAASLERVWQRHIADSAQLLDHLAGTATGPWLDLGTGAGFPGLVIAAMRPDLPTTLAEPRRRRIEWLERMAATLGLTRCSVEGRRIEAIDSCPAAVISARAFASLPKTIAAAQRFSTSDTTWLLPKGRSAAQEVDELPRLLRGMFHVEPSATDPSAGVVIGRGCIRVEGHHR